MKLLTLTLTFFLACHTTTANDVQARDFIDNVGSWFSSVFIPSDPTTASTSSTPTSTSQSVAATTTKDNKTTSNDDKTKTDTHTHTATKPPSTSSSSSTSSGTTLSTITTPATLSTSTASSATSTTSSVATNPANSTPTSAPLPSSSSSSSVPPGGIAVAVILSLFIICILAWVTFRYHPKCRAWWAARQERQYKERTYRDALDNAGGLAASPEARAKRAGLASFFAPRTVKLGNGKSLKRKSVNWGVPTHNHDGTRAMEETNNQGHRHHNMGIVGGILGHHHREYHHPSIPELPSPAAVTMTNSRSVPPYLKDEAAISPITPISAVSTRSGSMGSPLPYSPNLHGHNSYSSYGHGSGGRGSKYDKPLPEVKINGTVVHELP